MDYNQIKQQLRVEGFSIASNRYTEVEVNQIVKTIESATKTGQNKQSGVYAIRQLLQVVPELSTLLFTKKLQQLLDEVGGSEYFLTKALYFDKPSDTNWFVAYHQDLSISVDQKEEVNGYVHWTHKNGQFGVQPPEKILNDTITVRIHLDDANVHNGALYVIPGSHTQ